MVICPEEIVRLDSLLRTSFRITQETRYHTPQSYLITPLCQTQWTTRWLPLEKKNKKKTDSLQRVWNQPKLLTKTYIHICSAKCVGQENNYVWLHPSSSSWFTPGNPGVFGLCLVSVARSNIVTINAGCSLRVRLWYHFITLFSPPLCIIFPPLILLYRFLG